MRVRPFQPGWFLATAVFLCALAAGCATTQIDWNSRVGHYTYDQAVLELGPPDKLAQLQDGTKVAEWLVSRGYSHGDVTGFQGMHWQQYEQMPSPDRYLRLTFTPSGQLSAWQSVLK